MPELRTLLHQIWTVAGVALAVQSAPLPHLPDAGTVVNQKMEEDDGLASRTEATLTAPILLLGFTLPASLVLWHSTRNSRPGRDFDRFPRTWTGLVIALTCIGLAIVGNGLPVK